MPCGWWATLALVLAVVPWALVGVDDLDVRLEKSGLGLRPAAHRRTPRLTMALPEELAASNDSTGLLMPSGVAHSPSRLQSWQTTSKRLSNLCTIFGDAPSEPPTMPTPLPVVPPRD